MKALGIICEFNPLHNGHVYFINEIKKKYKDYIIVLVLNGYFLERGEMSVLSKEEKINLSLKYGVDLVLELPVLFGTQSADTFASKSIEILNNFKIEKLIFGSESTDIDKIYKLAKIQLEDKNYHEEVKTILKTGVNYPTALAKALKSEFNFTPNDLLGISYVKAILKNKYNIKYETIKRTNNYHDNNLDSSIVSASNIREKANKNNDINKYIPEDYSNILKLNDSKKMFDLLSLKILTDKSLTNYLDVDEGIENRLVEGIYKTKTIEDLIKYVKNKRFTYNKINRMFIHILLGITKEDAIEDINYTKVLGFNSLGKSYLKTIKKDVNISWKVDKKSLVYNYEIKAAKLYEILTGKKVYEYENSNKSIYLKD